MLIEEGYYSEISYLYGDGKNVWIANTNNFYSYNHETEEKKFYSEDINRL